MPPLRERGEDIALLFRLFALQMAEKYRMERVTLTPEAKELLMKYKWPGNVRQLKNITEQISILSRERTITAEMLQRFIPRDVESKQLVAPHKENDGEHGYDQEREVLFKILFELKGSVAELQREVNELKKRMGQDLLPVAHTHSLYLDPEMKPAAEDAIAEEYIEPEKERKIEGEATKNTEEDSRRPHEVERESLNLNKLERQMLEKALERNGGNRKKAAQELGMSDRTLYRRLKEYGLILLLCICSIVSFSSCSVSYKFNGASIDYSTTKTIEIADFPIRSAYVWGPMAPIFNNKLKDIYANHTKLIQVRRNGDLKIEGEITRYDQRNKSVSAEGYSAQTELSMTVNVRFTNNKNHAEDFEKQFTATSTYETTQTLNSVQEELVTQMVKEITDQIFNATVANW